MKKLFRLSKYSLFFIAIVVFFTKNISATQVEMKDGRVLQGKIAEIDSVTTSTAENLQEKLKSILVLDDGLRRMFLPKKQIVDIIQSNPSESLESFKIPQPKTSGSNFLKLLGQYTVIEDFDEFGRRRVEIDGKQYVQGITEINPRYLRIEGQNINWDMRIATNSLSRETLSRVLLQRTDPKNLEERKRLVRFYIQAERDRDARIEMEAILKDFADDARVVQELSAIKNAIVQSEARTMLAELENRRAAGQFELVRKMLNQFPIENVSGEILQRVRSMSRLDDELDQQRTTILEKLRSLVDQQTDEKTREIADEIFKEIEVGLDRNTLDRMSAFTISVDDPNRGFEEKIALAFSGWFVGGDNASGELSLALSMQKTRELVVQYLTKKDPHHREQIFQTLQAEEAGNVEMVAKIFPLLTPPFSLSVDPDPNREGYFMLETPAFADLPPFQYSVQLPPEYNPNRRYPMIVTLHGTTTPDQQIDWWCGSWQGNQRYGQASRHGYIVIAPSWNPENNPSYDFSAFAQAAVLYCYYDALRHFAVDSDHVFLTGHGLGGDAAWDIGFSHPDLWAGLIPINAYAGKNTYIRINVEHARYVPTYFIGGEIDNALWLLENRMHFDWYLSHGTQNTVVQFLGRGAEGFADEILKLFEWMKLQKREYPVREFSVTAMRPWTNTFWWVEVIGFSPKNMVDPMDWPIAGAKPAQIETTFHPAKNSLKVNTTAADKIIIWLSPELINFDLKTEIVVNTRKIPLQNNFAEPSLRDMLEDVRTRHDRKHPYWLRLETSGKK